LAKQDDTARRDLRELLTMLRDQLSMPPLSPALRTALEAILRMLGEQDLGKRVVMRDQISAYLAETWGEQ
jgi:nitrate/nitrite-specific signal transduction histidine kinase